MLASIPLLCVALLATAVPTEPPKLLPETGSRTRYALRLLGQTIGEPEIRFHPVQALEDGRKVRKLVFSSGISEKLQRLYPADTQFVSILDVATYKPLKSVYQMRSGDDRTKLELGYKGARLDARVTENGRARDVDDVYEAGMLDTISSVGWITSRKLEPGQIIQSPHHSTVRRYRLYATGEAIEEVTVPAGTFRSLRVEVRLYKWEDDAEAPVTALPEAREPFSHWTLWLAEDRWRTPVKLAAEVAVLGNIELHMTGRRFE